MDRPIYVPRPGDYFVQRTGGWQAQVIRTATASRWNHAGIVVATYGSGTAAGVLTLEAEPHNARIREMPRRGVLAVSPVMPDSVRNAVAAVGPSFQGTGYNWVGLAALFLATYGLDRHPDVLRRAVEAKLEDRSDLFCSQLVDVLLELCSFHLFDDGRPAGKVSPGDLEQLAQLKGWPTFALDDALVIAP